MIWHCIKREWRSTHSGTIWQGKKEVRAMDGMTLEKLQVIIEAQTEQYLRAMQKVQSQTNSTVSKVQNQVSKIKNVIGKVGKAVGIALSVAALVNFGKQCIDLGSDLQEVQNVVDVTFGGMSSTIDQFAKEAIEKFGLSELAAKQYTSTMGAMLKSMGFTGQAVSDMSMELTGLAGDMASFYNLDADEAFAKIRAGISGETEPLKQLGINLSVANLEQFALTQGIKKNYNAMTQQEQALLRYNYLLSVTSDAQGDFARTSDSWANQTKILAMRFDSLKASIGQGLINVFTPVIKVLNALIAKLQVAADAFRRFTEIITGRTSKGASSSVGNIATGLDTATQNANSLTGATKAAGGSAKKAAKEYGGLLGFDEINSLTKNTDTGGGAGDFSSDLGISEEIANAAEETDAGLNPVLQAVIDKLKELRDIFKEGFKAGLGDVSLEPLKNAIKGIKESLREIFTAPEVLNAADTWLDWVAYAAGQATGAVASVGITVATNLVGGVNKYLEQNTGRIKQFIINMFDITGDVAAIAGNFAQAAANIFSVFGGESGQQVTANIIGIISNAAMGVYELSAKLGRDVLDCITRPFIDNQGSFKTAIDGLLGVAAGALGNIKQVVDDTVGKAGEVYDEHLAPMFSSLAAGLSDITGTLLDAYNTYIIPVLEGLQQKVGPLIDEHIQPAINKALELIGKIADAVKDIWEQTLVPFINWFIANVAPNIAKGLDKVGSVFLTVAGVIWDVISSVLDALGGLIDFIAGVFTGDWERAWDGIKSFFSGIWEAIKSIVSAVWNAIKSIVSAAISVVSSVISTVLNTIKTIFSTIWNSIKTTVNTVWNAIKSTISTVINTISTIISTALNSIKTTFSTIWNSIKTTVTTTINSVKSTISTVMGSIQTGISTALSSIKTNWSNMWTNMKTTVLNIFNGIWSSIKGVINSIIGGIESMANAVIKGINGMIKALNNLSFDVPDWVPEIGGKTFGFNIPTISSISIPRLATGGVVDQATVAMIGEAGQEAVVPLENNTGWMDKIAARIGEIISVNLQAIVGEMDGGDEWQTIHTVVKLDSKTLVEQTDKFRRRKGYQMANA